MKTKGSKRTTLMRIAVVFLVSLILVGAINEGAYLLLKDESDRAPQAVELLIPAGTAERVAAGEGVPAIPDELTFVVGDVLLVVNQDTVDHQLGPIWVPAGSTGSLVLDQADKFSYRCSFQPSRYLGLNVRAGTTAWSRVQALLLATPPTAVLLFIYSLLIFPMHGSNPKKDQLVGV